MVQYECVETAVFFPAFQCYRKKFNMATWVLSADRTISKKGQGFPKRTSASSPQIKPPFFIIKI